jgi:hypothetical protein
MAEKKATKAEILTTLATQFAELFHDGDEAFATIPFNQTLRIRSQKFRAMLRNTYYSSTNDVPSAEAFSSAINTIEAIALRQGPEIKTFVRLAEVDGLIYVDLCNADSQVIKISADGWSVINDSSVKFIRVAGLKPLPIPEPGNFSVLRALSNVKDDVQFTLIIAWLVGAAKPDGPYPILILSGEHGSAKSSTARVLKSVFDPSEAVLRSEPKEPRDLMISAQRNHILSYDNLSNIPGWLSDCLCRLSTGGGFGTRQLFTDSDEIIFNAIRPVIINSISDIATRADLLDRSIIVNLPPIKESFRRTESELNRQFKEAHSQILGALCSAISGALANHGDIRLPRLPRMADFAIWITAAESALNWKKGYFLSCYDNNRKSANELALEANPVSPLLFKLLDKNLLSWAGKASELLEQLNGMATDATRREHGWPKTAHGLSGILRRLAPNLRAVGIDVHFERDPSSSRTRTIHIESTGAEVSEASEASSHDDKILDAEVGALDAPMDTPIPEASGNFTTTTDTLDALDAPSPTLSVSSNGAKCKHRIAGHACSVCGPDFTDPGFDGLGVS